MFIVPSVFKGATINKKMRLDHDSLRRPETSILRWLGYIGICLLLLGLYLHNFSDYMASLGVTGIIISAVCIAFGLIFSLPTKMYLTFLLVKREADQQASKNKRS